MKVTENKQKTEAEIIREYRVSELSCLGTPDIYGTNLKLNTTNGSTKYLRITNKELESIIAILTK